MPVSANIPDPNTSAATTYAPVKSDLPPHASEFSGNGFISRKTAWLITLVFIVSVFAPGIYQFAYETIVFKWPAVTELFMRRPTAESLKSFESDLNEQSRLGRWIRHTYWNLRAGALKKPEGIFLGSHGFVFTDDEMYPFSNQPLTTPLTSPTGTIMPALLDFDAQLRQRGVRLVLLPIPAKVCIYPENLALDYRASDGPALPPGYLDWIAQVRNAGIDVVDLTSPFWRAKDPSLEPVYWPRDNHWSYRGRSIAADLLADHLRPMTSNLPRIDFDTQTAQVDFDGYLATHIHFQANQLMQNGKPLVPGDSAPVLLLGDSFTLFWNSDGYGFADELMQRLHVPIQIFATLGEPINGPRQTLSQSPNALKNKKIVVWEFYCPYMWKEWKKVKLN